MDRKWLWIGGAAGAAAIILTKRKAIGNVAQTIVDMAHEELFKATIPGDARPYADLILQVAKEQNVDPFVIVALGQRETNWGTSKDLSQPGPAGTGDSGHGRGLMQIDDRSNADWLATHDWTDPYTNITKGVQILKGKMAVLSTNSNIKGLTDGETVTMGSTAATVRNAIINSIVTGKTKADPALVTTLMRWQSFRGGSNWRLVPGQKFPDPRPLSSDALISAAIAAYNTGEGNVIYSLAAGLPADITSAGSNYSADVYNNAVTMAAKFATGAATA